MNYGKRTTNTPTHRDTPLSRTPEPKFAMFLDLPEVTVRPSKKQIKSYTDKWNKESDILNKESNLIGAVNVSTNDANTRQLMYPPTKKVTEEIKKNNDLLDYGNPMDKPNLSKISTSRANLEKAKKIMQLRKKTIILE